MITQAIVGDYEWSDDDAGGMQVPMLIKANIGVNTSKS